MNITNCEYSHEYLHQYEHLQKYLLRYHDAVWSLCSPLAFEVVVLKHKKLVHQRAGITSFDFKITKRSARIAPVSSFHNGAGLEGGGL